MTTHPNRTTSTTRRAAGTATLVAALGAGLLATPPVAAAEPTARAATSVAREATTLRLPPPRGPHDVSTQVLHLVDPARRDPWVPSSGRRELMVTMTYPTRAGTTGRPARYLTPGESRAYLRFQTRQGSPLPPEVPLDVLASVRVGATRGAAPLPRRTGAGRPLVLLSPGFSLPRSALTGLATELASRGYVVASVDHVHESAGTALPGGRLARCAACDVEDYSRVARSRSTDLSFVLDRLLPHRAGRPAWAGSGVVDPGRVAVVGHSIGGNAAATVMQDDARVDVGVNLDGTFFAPAGGVDRPFMLLGTRDLHRPGGDDASWRRDFARLEGPRAWFTVAGSNHFSFLDYPGLIDQLGQLGRPSADAGGVQVVRRQGAGATTCHPAPRATATPPACRLGGVRRRHEVDGGAPGLTPSSETLPGRRAAAVTRTLVTGFLDVHLRGRDEAALDRAAERLPEVRRHRPTTG